jgi:serine/threonine-protein kinase
MSRSSSVNLVTAARVSQRRQAPRLLATFSPNALSSPDVPVCHRCRSVIDEPARFCPHCGENLAASRVRIGPGAELDVGWGRAVVGELIGEGGMGVVYRGWLYYNPAGPYAGTAPHIVAVKVLSPLLKGHERARRLFLGEAAALERLSHPNIVRFHALSQDLGQLALVIELVEGRPLNVVIADYRARAVRHGIPCMPLATAWQVFSQLLGALAAIHALGIIHRDVKPSNVLVRHDGVVKLTDFGIARVPAEEARNTGGMAPGTGAYMSPEQVLGQELDARADLYGAAIVLYEMLTGVTPFDTPERNEIMVRTAQVEETPPPITHWVAQAPPVLDVLMARALAKDARHRFSSAVELGNAIRVALALPETPGWDAQQEFAQSAPALSHPDTPALPAARRAEKLRTEMMAAYRKGM